MPELEAALDDLLERSHVGGTLVETKQAADFLVALMHPGQPLPAAPSKEARFDPAEVLRGDEERVRQRLNRVCPAAAAHYVAIWEAMTLPSATPVNNMFHAAREMMSAIVELVFPVAELVARRNDRVLPPRPEPPEQATGQWRRRVIGEGLGLRDADIADWDRVARQLHKRAHRHGSGPPLELSDALAEEALCAADVATVLIDAYELHFDVVLDEIARLRDGEQTRASAAELIALFPYDLRTAHYFFDGLTDTAWWRPLSGRGLFDRIPDPIDLIHPVWPASRYLARIAGQVRDTRSFTQLLIRIGERTANVRVHEDVVRAALALPPECGVEVLVKAGTWLRHGLHRSVGRLAGDPGVIRFPAWYAHLAVQVATSASLRAQDRENARDQLMTLLALNVDTEEGRVVTACLGTGDDLAWTIRHLRQHCTPSQLSFLLDRLIEILSTVSGELHADVTHALEAADYPTDDDDDAADRWRNWYLAELAAQPPTSDGSHLILRSWFDDQPVSDQEQALAAAMRGALALASQALTADPSTWNALGLMSAGSDDPIGLLDRLRIVLLSRHPAASPTWISTALSDRRLRESPTVRLEYCDLLAHRWEQLDSDVREVLIDAALDSAATSPAHLASLAALSSVCDDPRVEEAIRHLAAEAPWTPIRIPAAPREDSPPAPDLVPARLIDLTRDRAAMTARDWKTAVAALGRRSSSTPRVNPAREHGRLRRLDVHWLLQMNEDVNHGGWPTPRTLHRLARRLGSRAYRWDRVTLPPGRTVTGREALTAGERVPAFFAYLLAVDLLVASGDRPFPAPAKKRLIKLVKATRGLNTPARPCILTTLGWLSGAIFSADPDLHRRLLAPFLGELPDVAPPTAADDGRQSWLRSPGLDIACLFSGMLAARLPPPPGFVRANISLYRWAFRNGPSLPIHDDVRPSDLVMHLFGVLLTDLGTLDSPGPDTEALFELAPAHAVLGALRQLGTSTFPPSQREASAPRLRRTWEWVQDWILTDHDRSLLLGAIGTWVAHAETLDLLGGQWTLDQLFSSLERTSRLDDPNGVVESLTALAASDPDHAPHVVRYVLKIREAGLLEQVSEATAERLISVLAAAAPDNDVDRLKRYLIADGLVGPLAR